MSRAQGEAVTIDLVSVDARTGLPVILKNALGNVRVLQSYEQLIVDSVHVNSYDGNGSPGGSFPVDLHAGPGGGQSTTNGNVYVGSIGGQFDSVGGNTQAQGFNRIAFPHEGVSLPIGFTLIVFGGANMPVYVSGSGRIVTTTQPAGRQPWRDKLNP